MTGPLISKRKLHSLYWTKYLSQIQIAEMYHTTPTTIWRYMKRYGIRARDGADAQYSRSIQLSKETIDNIWKLYNIGFNRQKIALQLGITEQGVRKVIEGKCRGTSESLLLLNKQKTVALSFEQEQLIIGSLLGDASIIKRKRNTSTQFEFQVGHCKEQLGYLKFKSNLLDSKIRKTIKDIGSYSYGKKFYSTAYHNRYELERIYDITHNKVRKCISDEWLNKLSPLSIAIWYMDDGTSSYSKGCVFVRFSTLSFTKSECNKLRKRLLEFDIESTLQKHRDGYGYVIALCQRSVNRFMDLIEPYVVKCMKYKIKRRINDQSHSGIRNENK